VKNITGTQGLNGWYTSESVTVWLTSYDLPEGTGSGVNHTYYTLDQGPVQEYIVNSGIILVVTSQMYMTDQWAVNFWSADRAGNVEDHTKPGNTIQIKIDAAPPDVQITDPVDEQQVYLPFWVRANASDNAGIDRVEFDIEPFGQHPGLPYVDTEPPYEWLCNVSDINGTWTSGQGTPILGVNKMVRARAFDKSGQSWTSEAWVYIVNEENYGKFFFLGFIKNRYDAGSTITFQARLLFTLRLDTLQPALYHSAEQFVVAKDAKLGYIGRFFTIGFFRVALTG
ncbi:MAG TPA: Ig-like domain-containing protein, partial [Candidatus Thermoplasmatota archaeon]|nr:Ig-like domain-containing protein [Candidatus Thermoplasmatota archaeon]